MAPLDNDYPIDLQEILDTVDRAEVMTIRFAVLPQRLLLDMRCSETEGPLVKVVPRAQSVEDRFRSLKKLRPKFRLPERIVALWWPKQVETLVELGVWEHVAQRVAASGSPQSILACRDVLEELRALERQEIRNAVTGQGYDTVWPKR